MVTVTGRDWCLVAPWYRWELADESEPDRELHADRPALHQYATTDFVDDFLEDPRVSVVFDPRIDYSTPPVAGVNAGVVKLFQPSHARFYLVAIELHCARPGFPAVDPTSVAEAGFVVRRVADAAALNALDMADVSGARLARQRVQSVAGLRRSAGQDVLRRLHPFRSVDADRVLNRGLAARAASARSIVADRQLAAIRTKSGGEQGWVSTGEGTIGAWLPMTEAPDELVEAGYTLQALRADPDHPEHPALEGSMYFGLVPTASDEVNTSGKNRFDPNDEYIIRAFVRVDEGDCPGRLVWSKPSHPFSIAAFLDPVGTAQRPVEITMPDLDALRDSVAPPSVRMSSPAGSSFPFRGGKGVPVDNALNGGAQVCFHSIPLITIVAAFVLNIFMPIVIWIFQLWWMLRLKFCFPRPASAGAVDTLLRRPDINAGGIQAAVNFDFNTLNSDQRTELQIALSDYFDDLYSDADDVINNNDLKELVAIMAAQGHGLPNDGWPTYARGLTYTSPGKA